MTEFANAASQPSADLTQRVGMSHVTEQHCNKLGPAGKTLRTVLRLVFCYQLSKFGAGKMLKQLTKQAGTLYHSSALFGGWRMLFVGAKIIHHNPPRGYLV
jgi:hypothetical protein